MGRENLLGLGLIQISNFADPKMSTVSLSAEQKGFTELPSRKEQEGTSDFEGGALLG